MSASDTALHAASPVGQPDELTAVLRAAIGGDASAWRTLVEMYSRRVFALALSRLGGQELAEEITQSVFVTVAEQLGSKRYDEQGKFESWLFRIAANRVRDEARRQRRQATPTDPAHMPDAAADASESSNGSLDAMRLAMRGLPEQEQSVLQLRYHAQLPFAQIARVLDKPIGTILAQHHRALGKLKETLSQTP